MAPRVHWQHYTLVLHALRRFHPQAMRQIAAMSLFVALVSLINIATPWCLRQALDHLAAPDAHWRIAVYTLVWSLAQAAGFWKNTLAASLSAGFERGLSLALFDHFGRRPWHEQQEDNAPGAVLARLKRAATSAGSLTYGVAWVLLPILIELLGAAWLLARTQSWSIALILCATLSAFFTASLFAARAAHCITLRINQASNLLSAALVERLLFVPTQQRLNAHAHTLAEAQTHFTLWHRAIVSGNRQLGALYAGKILLVGTGLLAGLLVAAQAIATGDGSLGDWVMMNAYLLQFALPMTWLAVSVFELQKNLIALAEGADWLTSPALPIHPAPTRGTTIADCLQVRDLQPLHTLGRGQPVSFVLEPGSWLAFVGPSGCGKSSLLDALTKMTRFQGQVCFGALDARQTDDRHWRQWVVGVSQRVEVLAGSLRANLLYGLPCPVDEHRLQTACQTACLDSVIDDKPGGLDFILMPGGDNLSGGEIMRLAIARALLRAPRVLVLDEPTAALDAATEHTLLTRLRASGLTVVIASHSPACLAYCDQIIALPAPGRQLRCQLKIAPDPCLQPDEHG